MVSLYQTLGGTGKHTGTLSKAGPACAGLGRRVTVSETPLTLGGVGKLPLLLWSLWCLLAASLWPGPHLPWRCGGIPVQPLPRVRGPERSARLVIAGSGGGGSPGNLYGNDVSKVCSRMATQGGLTLGLCSTSGFVKNHLKLKRNNPVRPVRPALPAPTEHLLEQIASAPLRKNFDYTWDFAPSPVPALTFLV